MTESKHVHVSLAKNRSLCAFWGQEIVACRWICLILLEQCIVPDSVSSTMFDSTRPNSRVLVTEKSVYSSGLVYLKCMVYMLR